MERRELEKTVIKTHKRSTIPLLYAQLKKKKVPTKEALFKAVFEGEYTSKGDVKLRNELRLLTQAIEWFLVQRKQQTLLQPTAYEARWLLLQTYKDRGALGRLEQLWNRLYKTAVEERAYEQQVELVNFWFEHRRDTEEPSIGLYDALITLNSQAKTAALAQFQEQYKRLELHRAFLDRSYLAFQNDYQRPASTPAYELKQVLPNDDVVDYLTLLAESYHHQGERRIELLEQSLTHRSLLERYERYKELATQAIVTRAAIGVEYFLKKDYVQADHHYQQVLPFLERLPQVRKANVYYNYLFNLLCLGQYQAVLDWYAAQGEAVFEGHPFHYRAQYCCAWGNILLGNYEEALDHLLRYNLQERPHNDLVYGRVLLSILYSMQGELELAERELLNLRQKHYYDPFKEPFLVLVARLFHRLSQLLPVPDSKRRRRTAEQLRAEMDAFYVEHGEISSTLFYQWFIQMIDRILGGEQW